MLFDEGMEKWAKAYAEGCCDVVNHPDHYKGRNGMEAIEVIKEFTANQTGIEAACSANVIKYILRWKEKNGVEDLKKAVWYANYLIDHLEEKGYKNEY